MLIDTADEQLLTLLPHRSPMLLINEMVHVDDHSSSARVVISERSSFFEQQKGVPACIGLEYMGQTAALIAGLQLQKGTLQPHMGFLLGSRKFESTTDFFPSGSVLLVSCQEKAVSGSMATFDCQIQNENTQTVLATATLSVFRQEISGE